MEVSGQLHAPAPLPPGKEPLVPIEQEAGWAASKPFWTRWWREKFPAPAGNRTLEPDIIDEVKVKVKLPLCFNWAPRYDGVLGSVGTALNTLDHQSELRLSHSN
jgi:hypothetical protein